MSQYLEVCLLKEWHMVLLPSETALPLALYVKIMSDWELNRVLSQFPSRVSFTFIFDM